MALAVYRDLKQALTDGFTVYDRTNEGYLVRKMTQRGWTLARVVVARPPRVAMEPAQQQTRRSDGDAV